MEYLTAHFVFLCEHRREIIFNALERRNTKRLGTKVAITSLPPCFQSKEEKKNEEKMDRRTSEILYNYRCS